MPYRLICDDAINIARYTPKELDLVYFDPPFGTGNVQKLGDFKFDDVLTGLEYCKYLQKRIDAIITTINDSGVLCVHLDANYAYDINYRISLHLIGEIIWSYRRWSSKAKCLQQNHDKILIYGKKNKDIGRTIIASPIIPPSGKERLGYPTQKPVHLLKNIINICSSYTKINIVADPFVGSGTTGEAALLAGCRFLGMDISSTALNLSNERLSKIENKKFSEASEEIWI